MRNYLAYADGVVLVYAINSRESFSVAELIKRAVDKHKEKKEVSKLAALIVNSNLALDPNHHCGKQIGPIP